MRCLAGLFICRSTTLRRRALRPQLKRDPLGADNLPHKPGPVRNHTANYLPGLLLCVACRSADPTGALHAVSPELLRQAGLSGFVQFRVGLDSTGTPNVTQLKVLASSNPGFDAAVRRAIATWRPNVPPGTHSVEHAILFLMISDGTDSARACRPPRAYTVVCARPEPVVRYEVH